MLKKILVISPGQFGTHVGTYQYCKLLSENYSVTYLGFYEGRSVIECNEVNLIHLNRNKNPLLNKIIFVKYLYNLVKKSSFDYCLLNYFLGCSVIRFFIKKNIVVDIRTGFIFNSSFKRALYNILLTLEVRVFRNITVISQSLSKYLLLPKRAYHIPLGSPTFPKWKKDFLSFNILYVGTFNQRKLYKAIEGVALFYKEFNHKIKISLTLIGYGSESDLQLIEDSIVQSNASDFIKYLGTIRYPKLTKYFETHNIGLSFIPTTKYFDNQPPTKTFEYLSSGMITIATATSENINLINHSNGVLINDSPIGVYQGLKEVYLKRSEYSSFEIQYGSEMYSWENIVKNKLEPYLLKIK